MATDLSVVLADEPGKLAALGRALGSAGVNIEGIAGTTSRGSGVLHVLVDAGPAARKALEAAGIEVHTEREVVLAECDDRPGALGELADRLSQAGVNID
ncbi:MAG: ACT domain-containing protein, partial [Acidimicrobiia bacterium]